MVKYGKTMCEIVHHATFHMWMAKCIQSLAIVPIGLQCMLCEKSQGVATVLVSNCCFRGWHMG